MDDQPSTLKKFLFPSQIGAESGQFSQNIDQYLKVSLVHEDNEMSRRQDSASFRLLWGAWQKPAAKIGTVILFLSWLLLAVGTSAAVLSWIGTIGLATGTMLVGLSIFRSYSEQARKHTVQTEGEPAHGGFSPTQP